MDTDDNPLLSRPANPERLWGELRAKVPTDVLAVIDASAKADAAARGKEKSRDEKVNEILLEWKERKAQEATFIVNVLRGNPSGAERPVDSGFGGL